MLAKAGGFGAKREGMTDFERRMARQGRTRARNPGSGSDETYSTFANDIQVPTRGQFGVRSNPATDAAVAKAAETSAANTAQRRSGPIGLGDYLNHEFLQRQNAGQAAWDVGLIPNKTYPNVMDKVQVIGPNKIRIQSGVTGSYYTDPKTGRPVEDRTTPGGFRVINTGSKDAFTYIHGMEGFAPNQDYKAAYQTASDKLNNYKPADQGRIVEGPAPQTTLPGTHMEGRRVVQNAADIGPLHVPAVPSVFTTENRYLEKGGVMTPVENLTPQERVQRGVGGFWDTLLHSPASEKVKEFFGAGAGNRLGPALAPSTPTPVGVPGAVATGTQIPTTIGNTGFPRAVPIGQSNAQAARVGSPGKPSVATNASERPRTETTPMDVNKNPLSSQPTPGIAGGNNPAGPQGNVGVNITNPAPLTPAVRYQDERDPFQGFAV